MKLPSKIKGWLSTGLTAELSLEKSSEQLLTQYYETNKAGDLALLVARFNQPVFHFLLTLSDRVTAEDVVQSMWEKVIHSAQFAKQKTSDLQTNSLQPAKQNIAVKSWLFTIARNTLIDELRRQNRWQNESYEEHAVESFSPEKLLELKDRLALFNSALAKLSYAQREAYVFQQEGFTLVEICQVTGESFETIKSRLRYARNNLVKLMSQQ